jgi:predicted metal-dependent phosphoesterase TrpH
MIRPVRHPRLRMPSPIDLHSHSTVSDGFLAPAELVRHASGKGVQVLALTDHDDMNGLQEAARTAQEVGIAFINGVEISVTWHRRTLHVVGLKIDPDFVPLREGLERIRDSRHVRAEGMADSLSRAGISGSLDGAYAYTTQGGIIGRIHFARYLVEKGHARDVRSVFKRFLVKGRPGYQEHQWAGLEEALGWITGSGGIAVLAHPGRYTAGRKAMGKTTLHELLEEFVAAGGQAIEVVSGSHTPPQYAEFARYAKEFDLLCSCGSDFHGPEESYRDIGRLPDFPLECRPVWTKWEAATA